MARCDMHVHSWHSGKTNHVTLLEPTDSCSTPERIYRRAKARGMDLVTITDHDSIGGCVEFLARHPGTADFFISEEVSVPLPELGYNLHVGVYGMAPEDHAEIRARRRDPETLLDWLDGRGLFYAWNHPFYHFPRGAAGVRLLQRLLPRFAVCEGINSCLPPGLNTVFTDGLPAWRAAGGTMPALVAGSDSHSLWRVGRTWTEAPGATPAEFLTAVRRGESSVHGNNGTFWGVFVDAMSVYVGYERDLLWRHEIHTAWSRWKKIRNSFGWAGWLPVFTVGSFVYSWLQFRRFHRRLPDYAALWSRLNSKSQS
jgi:predicted metal-dependent phosphoesterase TrpH